MGLKRALHRVPRLLSLELLFQLDSYTFPNVWYFHTLIAFCDKFVHASPLPRLISKMC